MRRKRSPRNSSRFAICVPFVPALFRLTALAQHCFLESSPAANRAVDTVPDLEQPAPKKQRQNSCSVPGKSARNSRRRIPFASPLESARHGGNGAAQGWCREEIGARSPHHVGFREAPQVFQKFCGPDHGRSATRSWWYGALSDIEGMDGSDLVVNWRGELAAADGEELEPEKEAKWTRHFRFVCLEQSGCAPEDGWAASGPPRPV